MQRKSFASTSSAAGSSSGCSSTACCRRRRMQLQGKSAVITGAASGIGAEIARVFAAAGAKICIADIDGDLAKRKASELKGLGLRMDVTSEEEIERGVDEAARQLGGIDILV